MASLAVSSSRIITATGATAPPSPTAGASPQAGVGTRIPEGTTISLQAGTRLALALPVPAAADQDRQPGITVAGLPEPRTTALAGGGTVITLTIPSTSRGLQILAANWPDGVSETLELEVGSTVSVVAGLGEPDDVTVAPDGSVLFSELRTNTVGQVLGGGLVRILVSHLRIPEGLAASGVAQLLIAEQGTNRLLAWTPQGGVQTLLQLPPRPGVDGIDGLGLTVVAKQPVVLLPDSANGRMLLFPLDTRTTREVAGHWQRPVGAVVATDQLYIVDEYGGRLWRGPLEGPLKPFGPPLHLPDDVAVTPAGEILVNELGSGSSGGSIMEIAPDGSGRRILTGLRDPQGLVLDGGGNLILTESGAGRIESAVRTCLPIVLGNGQVSLHRAGPAQTIVLGSVCRGEVPPPTFGLAPGAIWPAPVGTVWPAGEATQLTLANGVTATLRAGAGAALLTLAPPADGAGPATLAVQWHPGARTIPRQIEVNLLP